ncbi:hypothetical protein PAV_1c08630 [Paenibacillus alvei DSM 29]|nr:hypothetical protein PAV_1c08630 [Paenibacillus alvei DSM 29]
MMYIHAVAFGQVGKLDLIHEVVLIEYKPKGRKFLYHTMNGFKRNITSWNHLSEAMSMEGYLRSDNFLINPRCVKKITGNWAKMVNGMDVYLTRQAKRDLKRLKKMHNYIL